MRLGCKLMTYLHGIVIPSASRIHLRYSLVTYAEHGNVTPLAPSTGAGTTVRHAVEVVAIRFRKKQKFLCNGEDRR